VSRFRSPLATLVVAWLVAACGTTVLTPAPTSTGAASPATGTPVPATPPPPTPVGSTADAPPCAPPDVAVNVTGEGAGGAILLVIDVINTGAAPCAVSGPPSSISLRAGGGNLPTSYLPRAWLGTSPDVVAPPVVLPPNWKARARAIWRNWCLGPADVSTVWVGLGKEAIDTSPDPLLTPPRCDNANAESTVEGFPFEEDTSGG
jgi:hypothetical protein